jgi:hypothetical protein
MVWDRTTIQHIHHTCPSALHHQHNLPQSEFFQAVQSIGFSTALSSIYLGNTIGLWLTTGTLRKRRSTHPLLTSRLRLRFEQTMPAQNTPIFASFPTHFSISDPLHLVFPHFPFLSKLHTGRFVRVVTKTTRSLPGHVPKCLNAKFGARVSLRFGNQGVPIES